MAPSLNQYKKAPAPCAHTQGTRAFVSFRGSTLVDTNFVSSQIRITAGSVFAYITSKSISTKSLSSVVH